MFTRSARQGISGSRNVRLMTNIVEPARRARREPVDTCRCPADAGVAGREGSLAGTSPGGPGARLRPALSGCSFFTTRQQFAGKCPVHHHELTELTESLRARWSLYQTRCSPSYHWRAVPPTISYGSRQAATAFASNTSLPIHAPVCDFSHSVVAVYRPLSVRRPGGVPGGGGLSHHRRKPREGVSVRVT